MILIDNLLKTSSHSNDGLSRGNRLRVIAGTDFRYSTSNDDNDNDNDICDIETYRTLYWIKILKGSSLTSSALLLVCVLMYLSRI